MTVYAPLTALIILHIFIYLNLTIIPPGNYLPSCLRHRER
jgi:hypothetical protein